MNQAAPVNSMYISHREKRLLLGTFYLCDQEQTLYTLLNMIRDKDGKFTYTILTINYIFHTIVTYTLNILLFTRHFFSTSSKPVLAAAIFSSSIDIMATYNNRMQVNISKRGQILLLQR